MRSLSLGLVPLTLLACVEGPSPTSAREPVALAGFEATVDPVAGTLQVRVSESGRGLFGPLTVEENGAPGLTAPDRVELVTLSVGACAGANTFGGEIQINSSYGALTKLFVKIDAILPRTGVQPNAALNDAVPPFDNSLGLWTYPGGPQTAETWCFDIVSAAPFVFYGRVFGDTSTRLNEASPWTTCGPREWAVDTGRGSTCECQPRFAGASCESCAPGYRGDDCDECADGFVATDRLSGGFDPDPSDLRTKSHAASAWELRCEPPPTRDCAALGCGPRGTCAPGDGYAVCVCDPGSTGATCEQCAPGYELDASGDCVLGASCRDRLCNGAGDCVQDAAGGFQCVCDDPMAPSLGCGAPEPVMLDATGVPTPWRSLYPGERVELDLPLDAAGMITELSVRAGPARVEPCDRSCSPGADVRLVADPMSMASGVELASLSAGPAAGPTLELDLAIVPPYYVPITGTVHAEFRPIYDRVLWFMKARGVRAGAVGISKGGVTVAKNGYGYRDFGLDADPWAHEGENGPLVWPSTPFRVASLTKPITAAAVRRAALDAGVDIGSASAGNRAATWIDASTGFNPVTDPVGFSYSTGGISADPAWSGVTIAQLINHNAGYVRDSAHAPLSNITPLNSSQLPNTGGVPGNQSPAALQTDLSFSNGSADMFFSTALYAIPALGVTNDPRVTFDKMVRAASAVRFDYPPGGNTTGDSYSNYGYGLLGRVLEGLSGVAYDPDEASVPFAAGAYPKLARDFLCPLGIPPSQLFIGGGRGSAGEPAYRDLNPLGQAPLDAWDLSDPRRLRWVNNANGGFFLACDEPDPADCDPGTPGDWTPGVNTRAAEGGVAMGALAPVGGWVSTVDAYLRFARSYRTSTGRRTDAVGVGSGAPLAGVAAYLPQSSHNGALPGTWTWVWQLAGTNASITVPNKVGVWSETLPVSAPTDMNGATIVNESLQPAKNCLVPSDVAVVAFFNSRADYRAPLGAISAQSNSSQAAVWGRVRDLLYDAVCEVDQANAWPAPGLELLAAPPPVCP